MSSLIFAKINVREELVRAISWKSSLSHVNLGMLVYVIVDDIVPEPDFPCLYDHYSI